MFKNFFRDSKKDTFKEKESQVGSSSYNETVKAPTALEEVDEDGFCVKPEEKCWKQPENEVATSMLTHTKTLSSLHKNVWKF